MEEICKYVQVQTFIPRIDIQFAKKIISYYTRMSCCGENFGNICGDFSTISIWL